MNRRLPVAGQKPVGDDGEAPVRPSELDEPDSHDGPGGPGEPGEPGEHGEDRLSDLLRLGIPAIGALIILSAGFLGQCFGS